MHGGWYPDHDRDHEPRYEPRHAAPPRPRRRWRAAAAAGLGVLAVVGAVLATTGGGAQPDALTRAAGPGPADLAPQRNLLREHGRLAAAQASLDATPSPAPTPTPGPTQTWAPAPTPTWTPAPTATPTPTDTAASTEPAGSPQQVAAGMLAAYGWGQDQMQPCLVPLWDQESGWRWDATNPSSGAYGIPQALPGSKMASAGADWRTDPATQIRWGLGYIQANYGDPCGAWAHEQADGWY